jgi:hypothetical protein
MSIDLRTELNPCDAITGFTADGPVGVDNTSGFFYEGTNAITTQHTNAAEHIYTTSIGGTRDLSDSTCYMILKDNLIATAANGGVQFVLFDGTDDIGYGVGGNDDVGMALDVFWNSYKLDVTEIGNAVYTNTYAGVLANLTTTAITGVGLGTVHLAKAQGNVDNIKLDRLSFHANGSYALRINGGTVGTPETTTDVLGDSVTTGWGIVANPVGALYTFHAPVEFGEPAANADSYYSATDEQWVLIGGDVGVGHFPFRVISNSTDTQSFVLDGVAITSVGTRATYDFSDTNINILDLNAVNFTDMGVMSWPTTTSGTRVVTNCIFNNGDLLDFGATTVTDAIINGTSRANGALTLDENTTYSANQDRLTFNSDGTGHAFEMAPTGAGPFTYNLDGWTFNDYAVTDGSTGNEVLFINPSTLSADITINISGGGDTPTIREVASYTGTITINNNVNVTLTGMRDNTEVRVLDNVTREFLAGIEDATTGTTNNRSFSFSLGAGTTVDIAVFNIAFVLPPNNRIENFVIPTSDTSIPISQVRDRNQIP